MAERRHAPAWQRSLARRLHAHGRRHPRVHFPGLDQPLRLLAARPAEAPERRPGRCGGDAGRRPDGRGGDAAPRAPMRASSRAGPRSCRDTRTSTTRSASPSTTTWSACSPTIPIATTPRSTARRCGSWSIVGARFSTWYEMFPRAEPRPGKHGTCGWCRDCHGGDGVRHRLPAAHPPDRAAFRKGKKQRPRGRGRRRRQPWAIGAEGEETKRRARVGTLADFAALVSAGAAKHGLEIALDIAFQCSPDHPYVREHPQWFRRGPTAPFNTPKTLPKNIRTSIRSTSSHDDWRELWEELKDVMHLLDRARTSAFFASIIPTPSRSPSGSGPSGNQAQHPDVLFLVRGLHAPQGHVPSGKAGFRASRTRTSHGGIPRGADRILDELTQDRVAILPAQPVAEHARHPDRVFAARRPSRVHDPPGFWPPRWRRTTVSTVRRSSCSRPAARARQRRVPQFRKVSRCSIGTYDNPRQPASDFITRINRSAGKTLCCRSDHNLRFHDADNGQLICYSKNERPISRDVILFTVVNLDPYHSQSGWVTSARFELVRAGSLPRSALPGARPPGCNCATSGRARATSSSLIRTSSMPARLPHSPADADREAFRA